MIKSYPLHWPEFRPRNRQFLVSAFKQTDGKAISHTLHEIELLGGEEVVISTNIKVRQDGLPYANQPRVSDPAVAVYFTYKGKQMCFACDKWESVYDNIYAIGMTINALRGIERWGSGSMVEQAFTGFVALPAPKDPYAILGIVPGATEDEINAAYRRAAKATAVPEQLYELNAARDKLRGK